MQNSEDPLEQFLAPNEDEEDDDPLTALIESVKKHNDFSTAQAHIALFWRSTCRACGATYETFEGLFEERTYARMRAKRMRKLQAPPSTQSPLPRRRDYVEQSIPYCEACADLTSYT